MKASVSLFRTSASLAVLTTALAVGACQTDGSGPTAADAPKTPAASARPDTPLTQTARPAEPAGDGEPMTRARAARECWMRTEKANPHQDLDKRADVVNKCIDDKLKAAGLGPPKS